MDLMQLTAVELGKKIKNKEIFLSTIHNNNELEEIKNKFSNIDDYYIIKDKKE